MIKSTTRIVLESTLPLRNICKEVRRFGRVLEPKVDPRNSLGIYPRLPF